MTSLKRYLITMSLLLAFAIVAGVIVWYMYQDLRPMAQKEDETIEEAAPLPPTESVNDEKNTETPIVISVDSLSEPQRKTLSAFGVSNTDFTITNAMLSCAKDAVGTERFEEIINGAAPTPLEAMKLLPCMKAK